MHPSDYDQRNHKLAKTIIDYFGYRYFLNKKVLDLGCFNGELANALARVGARITAVDARKEHLLAINKKYPHITTVHLDLDDPTDKGWGFGDFQFDVVLSLGVMSHLKDFSLHLERICSAADIVVLETEVLDSNDRAANSIFNEDKVVVDASYNGVVNITSSINIQNTLSELGATFRRLDETKLNTKHHRYDWQEKNTGRNTNCRRMWFVKRDKHIAQKVIHRQRMTRMQKEMEEQAALARERAGEEAKRAAELVLHPPLPQEVAFPPKPIMPPQSTIFQMQSIQTSNQSVQLFPLPSDLSSLRKNSERLRVLYLELGEQHGMRDAFNNVGVDLVAFDFWGLWEKCKNNNTIKEEFLQRVKSHKPHLIHMQLQFTGLLDNSILNEARNISPGVVMTNWSGDCRASAMSPFVNMTNGVDYSLISSTGQIDMYRNAGCKNVRYWQIGMDPKINFPMSKPEFKYDGVFLGNNYGNQFPDGRLRAEAAAKCKKVFGDRFGLFGSGFSNANGSVENKKANNVYNDSVCCVSISNFNNVAHYFSDRLLHCLGSGRPTISWYFPGIEDYFIEGENILIARSVQNLVDKIEWCKNNIAEANRIGNNGYRLVMRDHTFTSRVIELLTFTNLINKL